MIATGSAVAGVRQVILWDATTALCGTRLVISVVGQCHARATVACIARRANDVFAQAGASLAAVVGGAGIVVIAGFALMSIDAGTVGTGFALRTWQRIPNTDPGGATIVDGTRVTVVARRPVGNDLAYPCHA